MAEFVKNGIYFGCNIEDGSTVKIDNFNTNYQNANMVIVGNAGAGKTFAVQTIAERKRCDGEQVFIISPNKGGEYENGCRNVDGHYIQISPNSKHCINVMEIRDCEYIGSLLTEKRKQVHAFVSLIIRDMEYDEEHALYEAIFRTYKQFGFTECNSSLRNKKGNMKPMPTLEDLIIQLGVDKRAERIKYIMESVITETTKTFNGQTNVDIANDNDYIVFDVSELPDMMVEAGMFAVADFLFDQIRGFEVKDYVYNRERKRNVVIEDFGKIIGTKSTPLAASFVCRLFKEIRNYSGAAIAVTNDLKTFFELDGGKYGKDVINNCAFQYILRMTMEDAKLMADVLNLTEVECGDIVDFESGEGLLIAGNKRHVIKTVLTEAENELFTTNQKEMKNQMDKKNEKKTITADAAEQFEMLLSSLHSVRNALEKISPENLEKEVTPCKIKLINKILGDLQTFLNNERVKPYLGQLDEASNMTNSDVILVVDQYIVGMRLFKDKYTISENGGRQWNIKD